MSHTLHRAGALEDLREDFVLLGMCATGISHKGSARVKQRLYEILSKFPHVNCGDVKTGSLLNSDWESIHKGFVDTSVVHYVYTNKETMVAVLQAVAEADLGISVVLSGVISESEDCCRRAGLRPHSIQFSGGVLGDKSNLPPPEIMALTTMCGHGLVAPGLVLEMLRQVKKGKKTLSEAAAALGQPCLCGVFNPARAERLLAALL